MKPKNTKEWGEVIRYFNKLESGGYKNSQVKKKAKRLLKEKSSKVRSYAKKRGLVH